jgi:hypothetical protein
VVQQRDGDAHGVELRVQVPDQRGADAGAALLDVDEHRLQVRGRRPGGHAGDPAGILRRLGDKQADRAAVPLGQPRPGGGAGKAVADLLTDQPRGGLPPYRPAEVHVEADEPQLEVEHLLLVRRARGADRRAVRGPRRLHRAVRPAADGDDGERLQAVPQERGHAGDVHARPHHVRGRVRAPGGAGLGQVVAPLGEQQVGACRDLLPGQPGNQGEPLGRAPGLVQRLRRYVLVHADPEPRYPAVVAVDDQRLAAARGQRPGVGQQRVDGMPALADRAVDITDRLADHPGHRLPPVKARLERRLRGALYRPVSPFLQPTP